MAGDPMSYSDVLNQAFIWRAHADALAVALLKAKT